MTFQSQSFGDATIYCGDARDIVPTIRKSDMFLSDVPYLVTSGGKSKDPSAMQGGWMAEYDNDGAPITCDIEWPEIMQIASQCVDEGDIYIMANDKNVGPAFIAAMDAGLKLHNLLAWDKKTATANRWYMKNLEFVWYFYKGAARMINDCGSMQGIRFPHRDETKHPTEKPVQLMRFYIENSTDEGHVVVDPFMGTGSTGLAALRAKRKFIGIELEQEWFDVACKRFENLIHQEELFAA